MLASNDFVGYKKGIGMKSILLLAVLSVMTVFSTTASAAYKTCKVDLVNGRGIKVDTFFGYGFSRTRACLEAKKDCLRSKVTGHHRARFLTCKSRHSSRGTIGRGTTRRGGRGTTINRGRRSNRRDTVRTGRSGRGRGNSSRNSGRNGRNGRSGRN